MSVGSPRSCILALACVCAIGAESAPIVVPIEPGVYPIRVKPMPAPKAVRMLRIRPMAEPEPVLEPVRPPSPDPARVGRHVLEGHELYAFWTEPDYPRLSPGAERAWAYDRHDRFAEAWAELSTNELSASGVLLKANYLMFGRAGVVDPDPAAADGLIDALAARVESAEVGEDERRAAAQALLMHSAADYGTLDRFRYRAKTLLGVGTSRMEECAFGGVPFASAPDGQRSRPADAVSAFLASGGARAAFEVFVAGQVRTNGRADPFPEATPAEYEYFLRYAAIRGHARAREFFDAQGRLLTGDAYDYVVAQYRTDYGSRRPYLPLKGAPGFGRHGTIDGRGGYAVDGELRELMAPYGLEAHSYDVPMPGISDPRVLLQAERTIAAMRGDGRRGCDTCQPERLPYLSFTPTVTNGEAAALVVYMPGNGEQGEDLKLQFRQTACIRKVTSAEFQAKHPSYLVVIMPPSYGNENIPDGYPSYTGDNMITESYNDLILDFIRAAKGPEIDPARIYLTGLGSGGAAAIAMALDHPGRFAAVMPAWALPTCPLVHPTTPGAWWFAVKGKPEPDSGRSKRIEEFSANVEKSGGACRWSFHATPADGGWWWDAFWLGDEVWDWAFCRRAHGEEE